MASGILLAVLLAVLVGYKFEWDGAPKFTPRGVEEWTSTSRLLVTQRGFPWGRVTLPGLDEAGRPISRSAKSGLLFGDPGRFSTLAALYSVISLSDETRSRLPQQPSASQIRAAPLPLEGSAATVLPVLEISTTDAGATAAQQLNVSVVAALRSLLREQQDNADVPPNERVTLRTLDFSSPAKLTDSRSTPLPIVVFGLVLLCTIAWCHILHNLGAASRTAAVYGSSAGKQRLDAEHPDPLELWFRPNASSSRAEPFSPHRS